MSLRWFGGRISSALVYDPNNGQPIAGDSGTVWRDAQRATQVTALVDLNQAPITDSTIRSDEYGYMQPFGINTDPATEKVWVDFTAGLGPLVAIECNDRATYRLDLDSLPSATSVAKGIVELATSAETATGTDEGRAATPAGVTAAIAAIPKPTTINGPDLVTPMLAASQTLFFAHRGAHSLYPENSLEAMRSVVKDGFATECDLRILSTGQAVLLHDATIDRTMTGTGEVSSLTLAQWRNLRVLPQLSGGQKTMGAEWDQVLTDIGGRGILVPELNVPGSGAPMISTVVSRGLQRAVIFQCDSFEDMEAVTAAGCACLMLVPAVAPVLDGRTHAQLKARGVEFIGYNITVTQAEVALAKAAGLKVIIYTVNTRAELATQMAKGIDGVFTDDPWHVSGLYPILNADPFASGYAWPHLAGRDVAGSELTPDQLVPYVKLTPPRKLCVVAGSTSKQIHVAMGWAGQSRGPNLRVRFTATYLETAIEQGRFVGVFIGTQASPDTVFADGALAGQNGYHFIARRNGQIAAYRLAPATAAALLVASAVPATPLAAAGARSQPFRFEVAITASSVLITNLTTGLSVINANAAFRGLSRIDISAGGTDIELEDIGVEEL